MNYIDNRVENLKFAYIGGGSRNWAWGLMSDLAVAKDICGTIYLYDIDFEAAKHNEQIGNGIEESDWKYVAVKTIDEALDGADFVIISILPGTFDDMESDVHLPEQYGIYQSVGDTTGPACVRVPHIPKNTLLKKYLYLYLYSIYGILLIYDSRIWNKINLKTFFAV